MIYIRGNRADYDGWTRPGSTAGATDDLLPYFAAEDNERALRVPRRRAARCASSTPLGDRSPAAFLEAAAARGLRANEDFNGDHQEGVGWYQVHQRNGRRGSTAVSYLHPAMDRPNLTVQTTSRR